jgi:hypothetical protein
VPVLRSAQLAAALSGLPVSAGFTAGARGRETMSSGGILDGYHGTLIREGVSRKCALGRRPDSVTGIRVQEPLAAGLPSTTTVLSTSTRRRPRRA